MCKYVVGALVGCPLCDHGIPRGIHQPLTGQPLMGVISYVIAYHGVPPMEYPPIYSPMADSPME